MAKKRHQKFFKGVGRVSDPTPKVSDDTSLFRIVLNYVNFPTLTCVFPTPKSVFPTPFRPLKVSVYAGPTLPTPSGKIK